MIYKNTAELKSKIAVSYTHLDVYKRQVPCTLNIAMAGEMFYETQKGYIYFRCV